MDDKKYNGPDIDKMSVKEAIEYDIAMSHVISDPVARVPMTPVVIGSKVLKGVKNAVDAVKKKVGK